MANKRARRRKQAARSFAQKRSTANRAKVSNSAEGVTRNSRDKPMSSPQGLRENQGYPYHLPLHNTTVVLAVCLAIAISYFPATMAGVVWDDVVLRLAKPIHNWNGLWDLWIAPNSMLNHEGHYWPLLYTTFWIEHKLWEFKPIGYHIVNLVLHAGVTVLLWRMLLRLDVPGAWFAALIFAVHPVHAESVVWIIGRKDILATLFFLCAALSYINFVEQRKWQQYGLAVFMFVASILSKSIAVTLPLSLLVWHWWKQGRVTAKDVVRVSPIMGVGLLISYLDWLTYKTREVISFDYSFLERVLLAARALGLYVSKLVWPTELAVVYRQWEVSAYDWIAWGCLLAGSAIVLGLWHYRHRIGRGPLAGTLFFVITLSPLLGFLDYGYMQFAFAADRYQYLAGAGVLVPLSVALVYAARWLPHAEKFGARFIASVSTLTLVAVLGTLSWNHAGIYQDNGTFFEHILALNPEARGARHNYGNWLQKQGRIEEALATYYIALEKRPDYANLHNKIGTALEKLEQNEKAEASYRRALELKPTLFHAKNNLALRLTKDSQYSEAIDLYREVIKTNPEYASAYIGMGIALHGLNRPEEALRNFERAIVLDPTIEAAHTNRDVLLRHLQNKSESSTNNAP